MNQLFLMTVNVMTVYSIKNSNLFQSWSMGTGGFPVCEPKFVQCAAKGNCKSNFLKSENKISFIS